MAILSSNPLGKTGITVTRLSAGGHFTNGPCGHTDIARRVREIHHMIDSGITYFDVQWEPEEQAMAEVIKTRRDEIAIAWPLHGLTQLGGKLTAKYVVDYCHDHQKRYGVQHVEVLLWIALELSPDTQVSVIHELRTAFEQLRAEGFCDHLGFSCHHSAAMALHTISTCDCFKVMMVPYSPMHPAAGRQLLAEARARGVGTVGMKPFGGGGGFFNKVFASEFTRPDLAPFHHAAAPYQAAIKWVLQNPNLDCTVPGMHSVQQIDEILQAAAQPITPQDQQILDLLKTSQTQSGVETQLKNDWD